MHRNPLKSARLDTRVTPELLAEVRRAAAAQGRSLSDYVATTLQAAARNDLADMEIIHLSPEASEQFAAHLIDPPSIAPSLARAIKDRRRHVSQE